MAEHMQSARFGSGLGRFGVALLYGLFMEGVRFEWGLGAWIAYIWYLLEGPQG